MPIIRPELENLVAKQVDECVVLLATTLPDSFGVGVAMITEQRSKAA